MTVGTVMERTHSPLSIWFWGAYLVTTVTPGMSAKQFQRQLQLKRYETAFQLFHKLRAAMGSCNQDPIGGNGGRGYVEVGDTSIFGRSKRRKDGTSVQTCVIGAVEIERPGEDAKRRAGRLRLGVVSDRNAAPLHRFVSASVQPTARVVTDDWAGYRGLADLGYAHKVEASPLLLNVVLSNLRDWLAGIHHGVAPRHLQAYLNEFTFRFNHRLAPFNGFQDLLGLATDAASPTYASLYDGEWKHPNQ